MSDRAPESCCLCCGANAVVLVDDPIEVEFRDKTYLVPGIVRERCAICGAELMEPGQTDKALRMAADIARREKGLLSPEQIRQMRRELGLTQRGLEEILGTGEKTVVRWEKGTVFQSASADRMMRAIWRHPEIIPILTGAENLPTPRSTARSPSQTSTPDPQARQ